MKTQKQEIGRLALRVEGDWWVAYYALTDTMDGALELARIAMAAVIGPEGFERKQTFMGMMRDLVADIIEARWGVRPFYDDPDGRPAPEHERSGRA